jgi:Fimbrial assembly protein (PilN)
VKQQINLYQPIFRTPKRVFSAVALCQVLVLIGLGCAAFYGYAAWQLRGLTVRVAQLERARDHAIAQLETVRQQFPERTSNPLLQAELTDLQRKLKQMDTLAAALDDGVLGNTAGLSAYLTGLARQHLAGTSLTRIEIIEGGSTIGVHGQASSPELVPAYVQRLASEPAFAGKRFSNFELKQVTRKDAPAASTVEFSIQGEGLVKDDERG